MRDGTPDVVDELTTLARELERVATSTDGYDIAWRGIYEILMLRERLESAEGKLALLTQLGEDIARDMLDAAGEANADAVREPRRDA